MLSSQRFDGTVRWFDSLKGYGFIEVGESSAADAAAALAEADAEADAADVAAGVPKAAARAGRAESGGHVFVHHSNVRCRGMRALAEGERVEFDLALHNGSAVAIGVTAPGGAPVRGTRAHRRVPAERVAKHIARLSGDGAGAAGGAEGLSDTESDEMSDVLASLDWSAVSWTKLMGLLVQQGLPRRALEVLEFMPSAGISVDCVAYTVGITAAGAVGDVDRALTLLEAIRADADAGAGQPPDLIAYASTLDACAKARRLDDARRLLDQLRADGLRPNHVVYQILISAFGAAGDLESATGALSEYTADCGAALSDTVSNSPYVAYFSAACECGEPARVVDVLRELSERDAVGPRLGTYIAALSITDRHGADSCQAVLDFLEQDAVEKLVRGQTASGYESDFSDDEDDEEEDEASGSGSVGDGGSAGSNAQGASPGTHPVRHQVPRILRAAGKTIGRESSDGRMLDFVERIVDGANARGALVPHAVMRQALSAGDARNAESMLVLMREMELEPSTEDYNISMSIARAGTGTGARGSKGAGSARGKPNDAAVIGWWEEMGEYALDPDWFTCTQVVSSALRAGRPEVVEDVWEVLSADADVVMVQDHIAMYTTIMRVLGERGNPVAICSLLQRMLEDGIEMDAYAFRTAFTALEACGHWEGMKWSYAYGCAKDRIPNDVNIKMVYAALEHADYKLAVKAIDRVTHNFHRAERRSGRGSGAKGGAGAGGGGGANNAVARLNRVRRAHRVCTVAVSKFCTQETVHHVLDVMKLMWASKLHPNHITYSAALKSAAAAQAGDVVEVLLARLDQDLRDGLVSTHVITLTHAVAAAGRAGDARAVEAWLARAEEVGVGDEIIYTVGVEAASNCNDVEMAAGLLARMRARGHAPNAYTYSALIDCLGKRGLTDQAMQAFESMREEGLERDVMVYNTLLLAVAAGGEFHLIAGLLDEMRTDGVSPNATTEAVIQRILVMIDDVDLVSKGSFSALQRQTLTRALKLEAAAAARASLVAADLEEGATAAAAGGGGAPRLDRGSILDTLPDELEHTPAVSAGARD